MKKLNIFLLALAASVLSIPIIINCTTETETVSVDSVKKESGVNNPMFTLREERLKKVVEENPTGVFIDEETMEELQTDSIFEGSLERSFLFFIPTPQEIDPRIKRIDSI